MPIPDRTALFPAPASGSHNLAASTLTFTTPLSDRMASVTSMYIACPGVSGIGPISIDVVGAFGAPLASQTTYSYSLPLTLKDQGLALLFQSTRDFNALSFLVWFVDPTTNLWGAPLFVYSANTNVLENTPPYLTRLSSFIQSGMTTLVKAMDDISIGTVYRNISFRWEVPSLVSFSLLRCPYLHEIGCQVWQ
jgi:hypothetical protein